MDQPPPEVRVISSLITGKRNEEQHVFAAPL
jgi:hypothetical protein